MFSVRRLALLLSSAALAAAVTEACSSFDEASAPAQSSEAGPEASSIDASASGDASSDPDALVPEGPLPAGLVARWKFDGDGLDATGNRDNDMALNGTDFVPGVRGMALHCPDKATARAQNAATNFNLGTGSATFVSWVRFDPTATAPDASAPSARRTILTKHQNWTTSQDLGPGYGLGYVDGTQVSGGETYFSGSVGDGVTAFGVNGLVAIAHPGFDMVAFVVDTSAKTLSLYFNGAFVGSTGAAPAAPIDDPGPLTLCYTTPHPLRGALDEVMIFDHALTSLEIRAVKDAIAP